MHQDSDQNKNKFEIRSDESIDVYRSLLKLGQKPYRKTEKKKFSMSCNIIGSFRPLTKDYPEIFSIFNCSRQHYRASSTIKQSSHRSISRITEPSIFKTKLYPEYKHQFIKSLIELTLQTHETMYHQRNLKKSIRAVIILSFYFFPIRTTEGASRIKGIGPDIFEILKESERSCRGKPYYPPPGKFSSTASATLVSLLDFEIINNGYHTDVEDIPSSSLCSLEELICRINKYTHCIWSNGCEITHPVKYNLKKSNLESEWIQIRMLCKTLDFFDLEPYLKERKGNTLYPSGLAYQLTVSGRNIAQELKKKSSLVLVRNGPIRELACNKISHIYGNVTMNMDFREGGGGNKNLHKMCDILDNYKVPYVVRDLRVSDYIFFVGNKLAPYLVERKTADDIANSIADGRWLAQQLNMRKAQLILGQGNERKCSICYLIEGYTTRRAVCGRNVIISSYSQNVKNIENALNSLPLSGFSVIKTSNYMGSMNVLCHVVQEIAWKAKFGSIECIYQYDEFTRAINSCKGYKGDFPADNKYTNHAISVNNGVISQLVFSGVKPTICNFLMDTATNLNSTDESNRWEISRFMKLPIKRLKQILRERDEMIDGKRSILIERLLKEKKPEILITRSRCGQYVPKISSSNTAILVAMLINSNYASKTLTKERIIMLAEKTGISRDLVFENNEWYDAWSSVKDLTMGNPALIFVSKRTYSLTTHPEGSSGVDVAKALHIMAHRRGLCCCSDHISS